MVSAALCLTAFAGCLTVNATTGNGTFTVGSQKAKPGASVTVPVSITSDEASGGLAAAIFDVTFDPAVLTPTAVAAPSTDLAYGVDYRTSNGNEIDVKVDSTTGLGTIRVLASLKDSQLAPVKTGMIANITFTVKADAAIADTAITLSNAQACNFGTAGANGIYANDEDLIAMTTVDGKVTVASGDTQVNVNIKHNLSCDSKVEILFAVPASTFADCNEVYLVVDKNIYDTNGNVTGTEQSIIRNYSTTVLSGYYAFYYKGITAKEFGSEVNAVVYGVKADGSKIYSQTDTYSVLTYVLSKLSNSSTKAKLITLLVDLLDYGSAAQTYFTYNTSNYVIDKIDSSFLSSRGTLDKSVVNDAYTTTSNDGATITLRKNLSLASSIEILVGFAVEDTTDLKVKFDYTDISGVNQTKWVYANEFSSNSGLQFASFTEFSAFEMDKVMTATLYRGDTPISDTITYSIYSYASSRINNTNNLGILIQQMIKYGQSAYNYKYN